MSEPGWSLAPKTDCNQVSTLRVSEGLKKLFACAVERKIRLFEKARGSDRVASSRRAQRSLKYGIGREVALHISNVSEGRLMSHGKVGIVGYGVYIPRERMETAKTVREREKKRGKEVEKVIGKVRH